MEEKNRSKSATWSRSQYDDPETIEDVYESPEDISNKVCPITHDVIALIINLLIF